MAEGPFCPADMISYWKLDETSGTTYADYYNGNAATCPGTGQCPTPTTGRANGGQAFDGNDRIDVAADASFDWGADESFSIEFWMSRSGSLTANEVIVGRQGPTHPEPHLWVGAAYGDWVGYEDVAAFCLYEDSDTGECVTGETVVTGGGWHHIVAVHDADARELRIYVDGTEDGSIGEPGYPDYSAGFATTTALNIGWLNYGGGYYYNGTVDEVAIYDKALSEAEIQQHYDRGVAGRGYCFNPLIAIDKVANPSTAYVDDEVTYTYTLTNPGDDPLANVIVSDDQCRPVNFVEGDDNSDDALDPEETWTYACSINASVDITNTATATGTDSLGGTVSDTSTVFVNVISPDIDIAKTADRTIIYPGQAITYTYTVINLGDDPLTSVGVSDDMCNPVTLVSGDEDWDRVLDLDETWTYTCSAILSVDTLNTAVVTSTDSAGNIVSATVTTFVDVINPEIDIAKTANPMTIYAGDRVTYTYTVTNPKDDPLSNISVSDDHCNPGDLQSGDTNGNDKLDPGEIWIYGCSTTVDQDTINTATAEGINSLGDPVSDTAVASVNVINPDVDVTIAANPIRVQTGEWVTYTYTVANPGDDPLSGVTVSDDHCATVAFVGGDANLDGVLDLAESWVYRCSRALLENTTSTALVESVDSLGNAVNDTAVITVYVGHFVFLPIILNGK